jgi:class 3 adenylate cyclase
VRTFLIADVRGYTSFTQAHGDEEAGELAASLVAHEDHRAQGTAPS